MSVQAHISELETKYSIRILFAADAGSKAWGWSGKSTCNYIFLIS
jgi:hypothetical protein